MGTAPSRPAASASKPRATMNCSWTSTHTSTVARARRESRSRALHRRPAGPRGRRDGAPPGVRPSVRSPVPRICRPPRAGGPVFYQGDQFLLLELLGNGPGATHAHIAGSVHQAALDDHGFAAALGDGDAHLLALGIVTAGAGGQDHLQRRFGAVLEASLDPVGRDRRHRIDGADGPGRRG